MFIHIDGAFLVLHHTFHNPWTMKTDLSVQSEHQKRAASIIDFLDMMIDSKDDDIGNIDFILTYLCTY